MADSPAMDGNQGKSQEGKITFRFCRECSNMLFPKEDEVNNVLIYACRTCQFSQPATSSCIFRNTLAADTKETAGVIADVASDPTLPRTNIPCPKCSETDIVFFQSQVRTSETGMSLFYVCSTCNHQWSTNEELDNENKA